MPYTPEEIEKMPRGCFMENLDKLIADIDKEMRREYSGPGWTYWCRHYPSSETFKWIINTYDKAGWIINGIVKQDMGYRQGLSFFPKKDY